MGGRNLVVQPKLAGLLTGVHVNQHIPAVLVQSFPYACSVEQERFPHVSEMEYDSKGFTGQSRTYADKVNVCRQLRQIHCRLWSGAA